MTEFEFLARAQAVLDAIERATDAVADVIDIELSRSGNVLTLEMPEGGKIVVNTQTPMQQIWVAARSGGYHYALAADGRWCDTRDGSELFAALSRIVSAQGGAPVVLSAPH